MSTTPATFVVQFTVHGTPKPQGSKDAMPIYLGRGPARVFTGKVALVEAAAGLKTWRDNVCAAAMAATLHARVPLDAPLLVDMVFSLPRPRSHYRTGRNAHLLKDSAPIRPTAKPDLSKLVRAAEDAITTAGIWRDDALVVEYGRLGKVFAGSDDPNALPAPGAAIRIWQVTA